MFIKFSMKWITWESILNIIKITWMCKMVKCHKPTALINEGIKPDPEKVKADPVGYFKEYSQLYCKLCGKVLIK